uniref:HCLS1-associated protein X-1 n=1 Tax=Anas platyrhynchos TaxID=8839 RepID=A0A8B9SWN2_ANAPL
MSFYDAFRGFFGLPGGRRYRDRPLFGGAPRDEDEDEAAEGSPPAAAAPRCAGRTEVGAGGASCMGGSGPGAPSPRSPCGPPADLDSEVSSVGLGTILRPHEPQPRSFFQSVSVTKVTLPDGAVEERRTVQDSHGRRETTVTLRRGSQAFVSTTTEDGQSKDDPSAVLGSFFRRWFSGW